MQNFFSAVQGKFDAKYHGRYLGIIFEQIAAMRPEVIEPFLKISKLEDIWPLKSVQGVTTEIAYLEEGSFQQEKIDRRADLAIDLKRENKLGKILVEIKIKDNFLPGQLNEYITWARERESTAYDRAVLILTAFPIKPEEQKLIEDNSEYIRHIYLSQFIDILRPKAIKSELIALLVDYLCKEGYAMYQLQPRNLNGDSIDNTDYDSLLSFMVLTFLPGGGGNGKVVSAKKIIHGPAVFGNLIQNWQLISDRFTDVKLGGVRRPTIRYFPEQGTVNRVRPPTIRHTPEQGTSTIDTLCESTIWSERKKIRAHKQWGRYWMTADVIISKNLHIEWGQILQVQRGRTGETKGIQCGLYTVIRKGKDQLSGKITWLKDGVKNPILYSSEKFIEKLFSLVQQAEEEAIKKEPELKSTLDSRS